MYSLTEKVVLGVCVLFGAMCLYMAYKVARIDRDVRAIGGFR